MSDKEAAQFRLELLKLRYQNLETVVRLSSQIWQLGEMHVDLFAMFARHVGSGDQEVQMACARMEDFSERLKLETEQLRERESELSEYRSAIDEIQRGLDS